MAKKFLGCLRVLLAVLSDRPLRVKFGAAGEGHYFPSASRVLPIIAGADGEGEGDEAGAGADGGNAGSGGGSGGSEAGGSGEGEGGGREADEGEEGKDWRKELRTFERTARKGSEKKDKEIAELRQKLQEKEDEEKSEQEKAIEQARKEGRDEALTEAEKERRSDRLETAVVRAASKKLEVTVGDKMESKRFDDPGDAELYLRKKIADGELDEDDLFDEKGKVKSDVVERWLTMILEKKPRLAEDATTGRPRTAEGSADGGKGGEAEGNEGDMNARLRRRS